MADYAISNVPRRVVYAASGTGPYAFTFEILNQTDIAVYKASTLLTLTTDYTVTINANGTGSVTLVLTAGTSNITIVGAKNIQRTTDFTTGGDLFANTLNDELDNQTIFIQQVAETAERGLKAPVVDPTDINMTLPAKASRVGTVLAFNATTGNPEAGPSIGSVTTVAAQSANINTVATNIASVNTVAGNVTNVNTVAGISSNVTTVAGSIANVNAVGADLLEPTSEINTVAVNIANVNTVGNEIAYVIDVAQELGAGQDVTVVATNLAGTNTIGTVATNIANVNAVGNNIANVNTVAGINPDVTTVAGISSNVTTVAGVAAGVTTVAGISSNVTTVAGISANVTTVAGISGNVTTVATNNANVTTVAGSIANVNTVAGNIANVNQVAADTTVINSASANAATATTKAAEALASANSASASAAAASAVALGSEPVRHSVRPSLLLDFANTKTLDPRITFTRASTATNYDGKTTVKAEENLHANSQSLTATFVLSGGTGSLTANATTAPDGTTTAASLVPANASTALAYYGNTVIPAANSYTISIFAKANGMNFIAIGTNNSVAVVEANLSTGVISSGTGSIASVGNGWYRITAQASSYPNTVYYLQVRDTSGTATLSTSNGTNGVYVWGAQIEQRSFGTAYTATSGSPITNYIPALQTAAAGVARFEHNPVTGESLGLEIEEQRVNLSLRSDDLANATWVKVNSSISSNAVIAPDGTLTADALVEDATNNTHRLYQQVTIAANTTATLSAYVKRGAGSRNLYVQWNFGDGIFATFNLGTGVVIGTSTTGTGSLVGATITSVGNNWYRITLSGIASTTNANPFAQFYLTNSSTHDGSPASYTGDGFSSAYIWGAQLEAGAFATSYIPTVASQVTRSADAASMTGTNFSSWYRADEGTVYSEASGATINGSSGIYSISDGTGNNRIVSGFGSSMLFVGVSGTTQANLAVGSDTVNTYSKYSGAYKTNDFGFTRNGATVSTDTLGTLPIVTTLYFGAGATGVTSLNGTIKKVAYYPKRLTNAELQGLTTV